MSVSPPRAARALIGSLLPPQEQAELLGDLEERFRDKRARRGRLLADLWYWKQAVGAVPYLLIARFRPFRHRNRYATDRGLSLTGLGNAFRIVRREPVLAATTAVVLAMGIGATTAMYSIVAGLRQNLPLEDAHELVAVAQNDPPSGRVGLGFPSGTFEVLRDGQRSMDDIAAYQPTILQLDRWPSAPRRVAGATISPHAFGLLGVRPVVGRLLMEQDAAPGAPPVVLLGENHWHEAYGGDAAVVGSSVRVDGVDRTIVGILPAWFRFPIDQTAWIPLPTGSVSAEGDDAHGVVQVVGRLRDGVMLQRARSDVQDLASSTVAEQPGRIDAPVVTVRPFAESFLGRGTVARIMLLVVSFVLVIASANAANLLMGRALGRRKEVAVRLALGGSRWRIRLQFLAEAGVLACVGVAAGVCLAWLGVRWFDRAVLAPYVDLWWISVDVDRQALMFASVCGMAAALLAGVAPALRASDVDLQDAMKASREGVTKAGRRSLSGWLVAGQLSLSCTLLIFTTLLVRAVPGSEDLATYEPTEFITGRLTLGAFDYPDGDSRRRFARALETRLGSVPGVSGVALTTALPDLPAPLASVRRLSDPAPDRGIPVQIRSVSASYFPALGIEVREGRLFDMNDEPVADPIAVVDEALARRLAPEGSAVGLRIDIADAPAARIVGVVGTPGSELFAADNEARLFLPLSWRMPTEFYFVAKGSPTDATGGIRGAIADLDPNLPIQNLGSLHDAQLAASAIGRQVAGLFTVFGFAALLITIVGLYGTIASTARRRRRELGLRRALGGSTIHLVTTAAAGRPWLLSSGLLTGTGLAALLAPALPPDMTGERLVDPLVFLAIPLTLAMLSAVAIYLPSRRAIEADPMQELGAD